MRKPCSWKRTYSPTETTGRWRCAEKSVAMLSGRCHSCATGWRRVAHVEGATNRLPCSTGEGTPNAPTAPFRVPGARKVDQPSLPRAHCLAGRRGHPRGFHSRSAHDGRASMPGASIPPPIASPPPNPGSWDAGRRLRAGLSCSRRHLGSLLTPKTIPCSPKSCQFTPAPDPQLWDAEPGTRNANGRGIVQRPSVQKTRGPTMTTGSSPIRPAPRRPAHRRYRTGI